MCFVDVHCWLKILIIQMIDNSFQDMLQFSVYLLPSEFYLKRNLEFF